MCARVGLLCDRRSARDVSMKQIMDKESNERTIRGAYVKILAEGTLEAGGS